MTSKGHKGSESSSVATGGGRVVTPPPSTGMATGFVQIPRFFFFGGVGVWGSDSSPPDLLADGEGAHWTASPPKPHPRIGPRHRCAPDFESLATPLRERDRGKGKE